MEPKPTILRFKTNINCDGCIATVKPFLDQAEGICDWEADTTGRDKILTVTADGASERSIMETVQKAGFKIEPIHTAI